MKKREGFNAIGIIGLGLIGGSIAKAMNLNSPDTEIVTFPYPVELEDFNQLLKKVDLVIISTPLSQILPTAALIAARNSSHPLVVLDVGSVKGFIVAEFEALSSNTIEFVATHPMAGKELGGYDNSDPELFINKSWAIVPHAKNHPSTLNAIESLIHSLKANPIVLTPQEHDQYAALVSHLPGVIARSYHEFVTNTAPKALQLAGPGYASFTRLAHDNPELRREIELFNSSNIKHSLFNFMKAMKSFQQQDIPESPTMSVFEIASKKKASGEKVFNFAAGDPVIPNHPAILEKVLEKTKQGYLPYPPVDGILELREAFCNWINHSCSLNYQPEESFVTCGGKFALYAILACYLTPGDDVLAIAPYYVSYPGITSVLGAGFKVIQTSSANHWKITGKDLEINATKSTKFLFLNNASNPTGILYTKEELYDILRTAAKLGITVISDEVYSGLVYDSTSTFISCGQFTEFKDNVFVVQSCSKNFAMSGWRVGFILAQSSKFSRLKAFHQQTTSGVSLISQWGALGALLDGDSVNAYVKRILHKRTSLFVDLFSSLFPSKIEMPQSAIYAFIPLAAMGLKESINAVKLSQILIEQGNIAIVPGEAFGTPGYVRFACSIPEEEIEMGLYHLKKMISLIND